MSLGHVTLQFLAVRSAILATAWLLVLNSYISCMAYRALKSREISRENTGIFAHMWHQRSLLGVNQYRPLTLKDHLAKQSNLSDVSRF